MEKSINIQSKRHAFYFYIYSYFLNFFWLLLPFYEPSSLFDCFFANLFFLILIFNKFFSSMSFPSSCTVLEIVENLFLNSSFKGWHKLLLSINTLLEFSIIYVWYWLRMLLKETFRFLYDSNWPWLADNIFYPKGILLVRFVPNLHSSFWWIFYEDFFAINVSYFNRLFYIVAGLFYFICLKVILFDPSVFMLS